MVRGAQVQPRDKAEYLGNRGCDYKHISTACADVGQLNVQLPVVVVQETAENSCVHTIKGDDFGGAEESVED